MVEGYWDYVNNAGGDLSPHRFAFTQIVCVSETDAQAEKDYAEGVEYFYRFGNLVARRPHGSRLSEPPIDGARGRAGEAGASVSERGNNVQAAAAAPSEMTYRDYVERGHVIAGSPATVRQKLEELVKTLRIGQLICCMQVGNLNEELTNKNTSLFATEVMPHLRGIWSNYPDHWTPARAAVGASRGPERGQSLA